MGTLADFLGEAKMVEDLPPGDELRVRGENIGNMFTEMVDGLRRFEVVPIVSINMLMDVFWNLVGQKVVPSAVHETVPTVSFMGGLFEDKRRFAMILVPKNWLAMVAEDPIMQSGALIFAASQAKDWWLNRIGPGYNEQMVLDRAAAYESTFLHHIAQKDQNWHPNEYQQHVMTAFPKGMESFTGEL